MAGEAVSSSARYRAHIGVETDVANNVPTELGGRRPLLKKGAWLGGGGARWPERPTDAAQATLKCDRFRKGYQGRLQGAVYLVRQGPKRGHNLTNFEASPPGTQVDRKELTNGFLEFVGDFLILLLEYP